YHLTLVADQAVLNDEVGVAGRLFDLAARVDPLTRQPFGGNTGFDAPDGADMTAHVVLECTLPRADRSFELREDRLAPGRDTVVRIELRILGIQRAERGQVAAIEGLEPREHDVRRIAAHARPTTFTTT